MLKGTPWEAGHGGNLYKYSIHLTPGPAGVESQAAFFFSFLAGVEEAAFRALGMPALKTV